MRAFSLFLISLFACFSYADVLKLATSPDYKPFEYMENNEIVGFDIDLSRMIAKELGHELNILSMTFDGIIASLVTGKADFAASSLSMTQERKNKVDFSLPVYKSQNIFIKRKSSEDIKELKDLAGKKLAYMVGSIQEKAAKGVEGAKLVGIIEGTNVAMSVISGKNDAFVFEDIAGLEYVNKYPELEVLSVVPYDEGEAALAFPKGSKYVEDFNKVILKLKEDGRYQELLDKYNLKQQ